jgi:pheromone shutdown protein TraB
VWLWIANLPKNLSFKNPLRLPSRNYLVYLLILKRFRRTLGASFGVSWLSASHTSITQALALPTGVGAPATYIAMSIGCLGAY